MKDKAMLSEHLHPSDQQLLLAADGELPTRPAAQVHAHLAACWDCRVRLAEIEETIAAFARARHQTLDPQIPPIAGPRALLRARLGELSFKREASAWPWLFQLRSATAAATFMCVAFFIAAVLGRPLLYHSALPRANSTVVQFERGAEPDHSLTPGATRSVTIGDVCLMAHEEVVREVSTSLRQEVFQEYGIVNAHAGDFEIDYLIAPGLGGVEDIHNLWPEPYSSQIWNAHVKDALEEQLHQMVCAGKLDLSTAQRDIATDWIAAYKKYFHTDRAPSLRSDLIGSLGVPFAPYASLGSRAPQVNASRGIV